MQSTVKQVAERVGLPERTVRYYDRIALVSPVSRSSAGYRLYGPQDEGRLRFVRQAKTLGFSLDDIRDLMAAAERGCCGEVVPELDRLLDEKVAEIDAQLVELAAFRDRLMTFRAGRGSGCGCREHGAFCGCLDGTPPSAMQDVTIDMRRSTMENDADNIEPDVKGCTCGTADGGSCNCGDKCTCGSASTTADIQIEREPVSSEPGR